jgi:hypothetical protein
MQIKDGLIFVDYPSIGFACRYCHTEREGTRLLIDLHIASYFGMPHLKSSITLCSDEHSKKTTDLYFLLHITIQ